MRSVTYVTIVLSDKAEAETQFIQQLNAMADRIPVSTRHLIVTYVTIVLSEKAKAETQFIQQLKAMADRIPVSTSLILLCMLHKACYICYISSLRHWLSQKHSLYNS